MVRRRLRPTTTVNKSLFDIGASMEKNCFKCGVSKPLSEFYAHSAMTDGHLNKCKECNKKDVRNNYAKNRHKYAAYERMRFKLPSRKTSVIEAQRRMRTREPLKYKARQMVSRFVREGKIKRLPCSVCGNPNSQAHHEDYSKPLDVVWLCFKHHRERHGQVVLSA